MKKLCPHLMTWSVLPKDWTKSAPLKKTKYDGKEGVGGRTFRHQIAINIVTYFFQVLGSLEKLYKTYEIYTYYCQNNFSISNERYI